MRRHYSALSLRCSLSPTSMKERKVTPMRLKKALLSFFTLVWLSSDTADVVVATECPPPDYTTMSGTLTSPGYPDVFYGGNLDCTYNIKVSAGYRVELEITKLSIMGTMPDCNEDSLEILVGCGKTSIGKFCSCSDLSIPSKIYSLDECMTLVFKSDDSKTAEGFRATYTAVKNDTALDSSADCSNTDQSSPNGVYYTPNWPLTYPAKLTCSWLIHPPESKIVRMFFMSMKLDERDNACHPASSAFSGDELRINGTNTTGSQNDIRPRICELPNPAYFPIEGMQSIQVKFESHPPEERSGVIAGYATYKKGSLDSPDPGCREPTRLSSTPNTMGSSTPNTMGSSTPNTTEPSKRPTFPTPTSRGKRRVVTTLPLMIGALVITFAASVFGMKV